MVGYSKTLKSSRWNGLDLNPIALYHQVRVVIFSKVAAYVSQPVAFNGHLSVVMSDRPQKQNSEKADRSTFTNDVVAIS